jgi:hypothetical protein
MSLSGGREKREACRGKKNFEVVKNKVRQKENQSCQDRKRFQEILQIEEFGSIKAFIEVTEEEILERTLPALE